MQEQERIYLNRSTVARGVRKKTVTARRRRVLHNELRRAKRALPKGRVGAVVRGRDFAAELLDGMIAALSNRVPRLKGTGGRLVKRLINGSYLDRECPPTARTIHHALTLLREVTPLVSVDGRVWEIALDDFDAEDPDELEHEFEVWRQSKAASEMAVDWSQSDASADRDEPSCAVDGPQSDASAYSAGPEIAPSVRVREPAHKPPQHRLAPRPPRVRARVGTFHSVSGSPSAEVAAPVTRSALLAEVDGHRWLRWVAAVCLRYLEAEPSIEAVFQLVLADGRHEYLGRRGRWAARRALDSLVSRSWLVHGPLGWTIRPTETHFDLELLGVTPNPSSRRPSPKMSRHLERRGIDPRGLSAAEAGKVQRTLHRRTRMELLSPRQLKVVVAAGGGLAEFDIDALTSHKRENFRGLLDNVEREREQDLRLMPLPTLEVDTEAAKAHHRQVSTAWNQVLVWVERSHGRSASYNLALTGGGGSLPTMIRDASEDAISELEAVIAETTNPIAVARRCENHLRLCAEDAARALPEIRDEGQCDGMNARHSAAVDRFLATLKGDRR